uniref:Inositol hexakisphosphate and diphosphoinositol-pentakisphosphate kinase n=1 Tax=Macrostomum lignano TaxID=282301 RepID=A0A1I8GA60_9PLAT
MATEPDVNKAELGAEHSQQGHSSSNQAATGTGTEASPAKSPAKQTRFQIKVVNTSCEHRRSGSIEPTAATKSGTAAADGRSRSIGSRCTSQPPTPKMPGCSRPILLGLCAMAKKVKSKPMTAILTRLCRFPYIRLIIFEESVILNSEIEDWPVVDALISFYSNGFPLDKAIRYADLHKPYLVNDLRSQYILMDRQKVYRVLQERDIPVVRHAVYNWSAESESSSPGLVEQDDSISVNGVAFQKPFVEKPLDAENHNIHIYFPSSAGGGSVRLFRKIGDRSSTYHSDSRVRNHGSYVYEDFMATDGTDVKVYAIGKDYAHAEARKSPALDGKVERDPEGKEMRYPIILSAKEKIIAKKVVEAFNQNVCGFDLLRANGVSYVCDVNGFSFVKSSKKYYDDCAFMLGVMVTSAIAPSLSLSINYPKMDKPPLIRTTFGTVMELRCVIAVIRHGDRTPKQKVKVEVFHSRFFSLFNRHRVTPTEAKLKKPTVMQELLDVVRELLQVIAENPHHHGIKENRLKLKQVRQVLEMYGHFSGINRKAQLKFTPKKGHESMTDPPEPASRDTGHLLLVLKWGGELTDEGRSQAEKLGRAFRVIYPGGESYSQKDGLGLLRLHSTYRHDLKIYASDEGRVQTTAAAFAKGFLDLEGPLTPILVQMVKSAHTNGLLDSDNDATQYMAVVKEKIKASLEVDRNWTESDVKQLAPDRTASLLQAMYSIANPARVCCKMHACMQAICDRLEKRSKDPHWARFQLYHDETWGMALQRWRKLVKDFRSGNNSGQFVFSKVPDIYDNIKYDLMHNDRYCWIWTRPGGYIVVPSEYGITREEKLVIAQRICTPLLKKILADTQYTSILDVDDCCSTRLNTAYSLDVSSPERFVRTRLYFTSESHIHSLLTVLRFGGLIDPARDPQWARAMQYCDAVPELNYLTQIVFMIYENPQQELGSENRFHVELHFSPGSVNPEPLHQQHQPESPPTPPAHLGGSGKFGGGFRPKAGNGNCGDGDRKRRNHSVCSTPRSTTFAEFPSAATTPSKSSATSAAAPQQVGRFEMSLPASSSSAASSVGEQKLASNMATLVVVSDEGGGQVSGDSVSNGGSSNQASPLRHISRDRQLSGRRRGQGAKGGVKSSGDSDPANRPRQNSWSEASAPDHRSGRETPSEGADFLDVTSFAPGSYDTYHGSQDFRRVFGCVNFKGLMPAQPLALHLFSTNLIRSGLSDPSCSSQATRGPPAAAAPPQPVSGPAPPTCSRPTRSCLRRFNLSRRLCPRRHQIDVARINRRQHSVLVDAEESEETPTAVDADDDELEAVGQSRLDTAPCVPEIFPLETLHNSLTLRQLELFLHRFTRVKLQTPWSSRRHSLKTEN